MKCECGGRLRAAYNRFCCLGITDVPKTHFDQAATWIKTGPNRYTEYMPHICDKCGNMKAVKTGKIHYSEEAEIGGRHDESEA